MYSDVFKYSQAIATATLSQSYATKVICSPNSGGGIILLNKQSNQSSRISLKAFCIWLNKMSSIGIWKSLTFLCTMEKPKLLILDLLNLPSTFNFEFRTKFKDINIGSPIYMSP